jgi:hypothetical protein
MPTLPQDWFGLPFSGRARQHADRSIRLRWLYGCYNPVWPQVPLRDLQRRGGSISSPVSAAEIGVHHNTVGAARRSGGDYSPPERVGQDGKSYSIRQRVTEDPDIPSGLAAEAAKLPFTTLDRNQVVGTDHLQSPKKSPRWGIASLKIQQIRLTETACRSLCPNASPCRAHPTNDQLGRHSTYKCSNP